MSKSSEGKISAGAWPQRWAWLIPFAWASLQTLAVDDLGPLYDRFPLTVGDGVRTEMFGPLFYRQQEESTTSWGVPPLLSYETDPITDLTEIDVLYPFLTYNRFGPAFRWQLVQLLSFSGGETLDEDQTRRFTIFPLYFQQRSEKPELNYTAFVPIYGTLKNRLLRDEIHFVLFPGYSKTRKREVVTWNYLYPVFHWRRGPGLTGWQAWPLVGHETKAVTTRTNTWGDTELVAGHKKLFVLWPFFFRNELGIGTENPQDQLVLLPLFSIQRSPLRDSYTFPSPLGFSYTVDREKKFREWAFPWPFIVFSRGEGKTVNRVWPLFGFAENPTLESNFVLWPVYKYNRATSAPLDRHRTRILLFLYSDLIERNTETGTALRRRDFWPLYTHRQDHQGNVRFQALGLLEPLLPHSRSIERSYSPLWSIWRYEKNGKTGATSQSLLWNLYRRQTVPNGKKLSLLFGLFRYQSGPEGTRWRVFYIPFGKKKSPAKSGTSE